MKEILIPYKGQDVVLVKPDPEESKRKEQEMKVQMLSTTMRNIDRQYKKDPKRRKHYPKDMATQNNFLSEAKFYLEQHNYDYQQAVEQFKSDLLYQLQHEKQQRASTSSRSGKKKCEIF
uniref:Uncharacterized protein n=1 Tax=Strombidium inclinatum TaxID=197538 RepID=A0A7S3INQ5_9SPIT|mmetsp:Transcript_30908/g.47284  ORF Transcript_30908/g.47284 Transcript_30908/m.47284 type:complete len:119 (+) Transcript_30908:300-656(+)